MYQFSINPFFQYYGDMITLMMTAAWSTSFTIISETNVKLEFVYGWIIYRAALIVFIARKKVSVP